jgi:hypothetical protein
MSLQGKWIALAKQWLIANGPCTIHEYMAGVIPLMPTHIIFNRKRASQRQLARYAISRIAVVSNELIAAKQNGKLSLLKKYDHDQMIDDFTNENGDLVLAFDKTHDRKRRDAFRKYIKCCGYRTADFKTYQKEQ